MKFTVGMSVRFLNEKGSGKIVKLLNSQMALVEIEDGFEIPFSLSELVPAESKSAKEEAVDKLSAGEKHTHLTLQKIPNSLVALFKPIENEAGQIAEFGLELINKTGYDALFTFSLPEQKKWRTVFTGNLKNNHHVRINTIDKRFIESWCTFKVDALFHESDAHENLKPCQEIIRINSSKFYKNSSFTENPYMQGIALVQSVYDIDQKFDHHHLSHMTANQIEELFRKKSLQHKPHELGISKAKQGITEWEIDLHIEELMDNFKGMTNAQIIQTQLSHLQKTIDRAIASNIKRLTVIHGVGNGKLKQEVRNYVNSIEGLECQDASYDRYGYGATLVLLHG